MFSAQEKRRRYLQVEAALAEAEGELGFIPAEAAAEIARVARNITLDPARLDARVAAHGHTMMALVEELAEAVGEHGGWVHWGATTQNIQQTGDTLILRDVHDAVRRSVREALLALAELADRTAAMPMPGRTHWQHAVPITFGVKAATWADQFIRHLERLDELRPRLARSMTGGAAGTFASFGERGPALQARVAEILGLSPMPVPSRAIVDHMAEFVLLLGLISATAQSVAEEVQPEHPEIGEAHEAIPPGQVGSSTMPQKRVAPHVGVLIIAAATARAAAPLALEAMLQSHEVDGTRSVMMDRALEQASTNTMAALDALIPLIQRLEVDPDRMRRNLALTNGLINAEAAMLALADALGRQEAHHVVHHAVERVNTEGISFSDALLADDHVAAALSREQIEALLDPANYTGLSEQIARDAARSARAAAERNSITTPTATD